MWSDQQLRDYHEQGFARCPGLVGAEDVAKLRDEANAYIARYQGDGPGSGDDEHRVHCVRESSGAVRSLFAMHREIEAHRQAIRLPQIAGPLKQILGGDAYVFHSKVNIKEAFAGTVWLWHQDYGYWQHDGVDDRMASILIMLDRTTIHGGCILFVPGSHRWGVLDHHSDDKTTNYKQWCVTPPVLQERLKDDSVLVPAIGDPGDVFFFDCNVLHGSGHNMAPQARKSLIYACAHIDNRPRPVDNPRPDWVVDREFENVTAHVDYDVAKV
jgi:ectoine hydroxylase